MEVDFEKVADEMDNSAKYLQELFIRWTLLFKSVNAVAFIIFMLVCIFPVVAGFVGSVVSEDGFNLQNYTGILDSRQTVLFGRVRHLVR